MLRDLSNICVFAISYVYMCEYNMYIYIYIYKECTFLLHMGYGCIRVYIYVRTIMYRILPNTGLEYMCIWGVPSSHMYAV